MDFHLQHMSTHPSLSQSSLHISLQLLLSIKLIDTHACIPDNFLQVNDLTFNLILTLVQLEASPATILNQITTPELKAITHDVSDRFNTPP
jgi:hypothetical protein